MEVRGGWHFGMPRHMALGNRERCGVAPYRFELCSILELTQLHKHKSSNGLVNKKPLAHKSPSTQGICPTTQVSRCTSYTVIMHTPPTHVNTMKLIR